MFVSKTAAMLLHSLALSSTSTLNNSRSPFRVVGIFFIAICLSFQLSAQSDRQEDPFTIRSIYDEALENGQAYEWLRVLTKEVGGRLAGSPGAAAAVVSMRRIMEDLGFDTVYLQPCYAPRWERGPAAVGRIVNNEQVGTEPLRVVALGNSIGTGPDGVTAEIIEVFDLDTLEVLGREGIAGKIVFFNRPMDPKQINTFAAYGGAVSQRAYGATMAGRYGAVATLTRSMTTNLDDVPHTGSLLYVEGDRRIPGLSVSTNDAERLSHLLRQGPVQVHLQTNCRILSPVLSYNVIGELKGSTYPDEIILVGGHLDSWDLGEGPMTTELAVYNLCRYGPCYSKLITARSGPFAVCFS